MGLVHEESSMIIRPWVFEYYETKVGNEFVLKTGGEDSYLIFVGNPEQRGGLLSTLLDLL